MAFAHNWLSDDISLKHYILVISMSIYHRYFVYNGLHSNKMSATMKNK